MTARHAAPDHHVYFASLLDNGHAMLFPCDGEGNVDITGLSPLARNNYLFARAMRGREFADPAVIHELTPSIPKAADPLRTPPFHND